MDEFQSKTAKIPNKLPKGGRPVMGQELEGKELKDYLYQNKISKYIKVYLTEYEYDLLNEKHEEIKKIVNIDRSTFIKKGIFNEDSAHLIKQKNNNILIKDINKIGVNINQLVKKINGYSTLNNSIHYQISDIQKELNSLQKTISSLL